MKKFRPINQKNILQIFENKTGLTLTPPKSHHYGVRTAIALGLATIFGCTIVSATDLFSSLNNDQLSLLASYEGNGIVSVTVENKSSKHLVFEENLKVIRWTTSEELPSSGTVSFQGTKIPAHSSGTMTIDLSSAYDVELLEQPLPARDGYYLLLTNNGFLFGQDWMCTVPFCEPLEPEVQTTSQPESRVNTEFLEEISENLQFYFQGEPLYGEELRTLNDAYQREVEALFSQFSGTVVPSVVSGLLVGNPEPSVVFDPDQPQEIQPQLIWEQYSSVDLNNKLLATEKEKALILSAIVPLSTYSNAGADIPLFYLFSYEKAAVTEESCAFIRGKLIPFSQLQQYLIYEDDQYLLYDFSALIYSDWQEYVQQAVSQRNDIRWDEKTQAMVQRIYDYYKENLSKLIYLRS